MFGMIAHMALHQNSSKKVADTHYCDYYYNLLTIIDPFPISGPKWSSTQPSLIGTGPPARARWAGDDFIKQ